MKVPADVKVYTVEIQAIAKAGLGFIFLSSKLLIKIQIYNFLDI